LKAWLVFYLLFWAVDDSIDGLWWWTLALLPVPHDGVEPGCAEQRLSGGVVVTIAPVDVVVWCGGLVIVTRRYGWRPVRWRENGIDWYAFLNGIRYY
jgi:hypothetical protein